MDYVELQDSEEEQYNQELRYLDEDNQSSIYAEIEEERLNNRESKLINKSEIYQTNRSHRNSKNRSKISIDEDPLDVEPLGKPSIQKPQDSTTNNKEVFDIEDPW